jgi:hypothetical protein
MLVDHADFLNQKYFCFCFLFWWFVFIGCINFSNVSPTLRDERPGGYAWGQLVCATRHGRRVLPALPLLDPLRALAVSTFVEPKYVFFWCLGLCGLNE